jgi:hypothetical protein
MRRVLTLFLAGILVPLLTQSVFAQADAGGSQEMEHPHGKVLGTVVEGNTTIVFEAANESDIQMGQLKTWSEFAREHPEIAREVTRRPILTQRPRYLKKHPDLKKFFVEHPDIQKAMTENPGNFVAAH